MPSRNDHITVYEFEFTYLDDSRIERRGYVTGRTRDGARRFAESTIGTQVLDMNSAGHFYRRPDEYVAQVRT